MEFNNESDNEDFDEEEEFYEPYTWAQATASILNSLFWSTTVLLIITSYNGHKLPWEK